MKDVSEFLTAIQAGSKSGKDRDHKRSTKAPKLSGTKDLSDAPKKSSESKHEIKKDEKPAKSKKTDDKSKKRKDARSQVETHDAASSSKSDVLVSKPPASTTGRAKFVVEPASQWYDALPPLPTPPGALQTPSPAQLSDLNARAAQLLAADAQAYQASSASTGNSVADNHFLQTILAKGTLSDRLSALTLLVQASPVHNAKALETLKSMAERGRGKGGRDEGLKAVRCVVDWWIGGGAPNRKLRCVI